MRPQLMACALSLALGACQVAEAKVWNLEQTHDADGGVRRLGAPMGDFEFVLRGFAASFQGGSLLEGLGVKGDKPIEDPLEVSLEALFELGEMAPRDARVAGLQVQYFSWLAVDDEYLLARERATLELGRCAQRLGLFETAPEPQTPATPEQLLAVLRPLLVECARLLDQPLVALDAQVAAEQAALPPLSLEQACAGVRALPLDRQGARRALSLTTLLVGRASPRAEAFRELFALHTELQLALVRMALDRARADGADWVRAAAFEACARAADTAVAGGIDGARAAQWNNFEWALEDRGRETRARALELLVELELPDGTAERRERLYARLVDLCTDEDGRISAAAGRALSALTPEATQSQRVEDWLRWWRTRDAAGQASAG